MLALRRADHPHDGSSGERAEAHVQEGDRLSRAPRAHGRSTLDEELVSHGDVAGILTAASPRAPRPHAPRLGAGMAAVPRPPTLVGAARARRG